MGDIHSLFLHQNSLVFLRLNGKQIAQQIFECDLSVPRRELIKGWRGHICITVIIQPILSQTLQLNNIPKIKAYSVLKNQYCVATLLEIFLSLSRISMNILKIMEFYSLHGSSKD